VSDESQPAVRIEAMTVADLDAVVEIEQASFLTPWSRTAFLHELERNRVAETWVAREAVPPREPSSPPDRVVGYLCLWAVAGEVHVTNLAVAPSRRGRGIGGFLLGALLERHRALGATVVYLEVRPGNVEARRLYARLGFRETGRRRGYYVDTGEDALLMEARLSGGAPEPPAGGPDVERNPSAG
jgi:ribosomal-protein-alanine N-acetyltransferase